MTPPRPTVVDGLPPCAYWEHDPSTWCPDGARWWVARTGARTGRTSTVVMCTYHRDQAIGWAKIDPDTTLVHGALVRHRPPKAR